MYNVKKVYCVRDEFCIIENDGSCYFSRSEFGKFKEYKLLQQSSNCWNIQIIDGIVTGQHKWFFLDKYGVIYKVEYKEQSFDDGNYWVEKICIKHGINRIMMIHSELILIWDVMYCTKSDDNDEYIETLPPHKRRKTNLQ